MFDGKVYGAVWVRTTEFDGNRGDITVIDEFDFGCMCNFTSISGGWVGGGGIWCLVDLVILGGGGGCIVIFGLEGGFMIDVRAVRDCTYVEFFRWSVIFEEN